MPNLSIPRGRSGFARSRTDLRAAHRAGPVHSRRAPTAPAPAASPPRRLGRRPVLDGLRGIAVLLVVAEHTGLLQNGFLGVDVFFVLSGFLITTLLFEEFERVGRISLAGFYRRRVRRLVPAIGLLALLALAADTLLYPLTGWDLGLKLATTFGFANNWVAGLGLDHGQALGALNPTWSLAQEEQFYLLWPLVLILALRLGARPGWILAGLGLVIAALLLGEPHIAGWFSHYDPYYSPVDRAAELLLGCAGSILWRRRMLPLPGSAAAGRSPSRARSWLTRGLVELVLAALLLAFGWLLLEDHPQDPRWLYLEAAALALPGLLLVIQVPDSLFGRVLSAVPLRAVGRVSYCLYLIHLLIRNAIVQVLPSLQNGWALAGLTLAASLGLATLSLHLVETPVREGRWPLGLGRLGGALSRALSALDRPASRPATQLRRSAVRSSA